MDDAHVLLEDVLERLARIEERLAALQSEVAKLNGLPRRVHSLEMWRAGLTAVGAFLAAALGIVLTWMRGITR